MPPANDLGFARSQDNPFDVILVVLVDAAVTSNTAALGSNLTHVISAGLQSETCFAIMVFAPTIVANALSTSVPLSTLPRFGTHQSSTPP